MTQQDPAAAPGTAPGAADGTGDDRVDAALGQLAGLAGLPVHEHPAVFGQVHEALAGALGTLDGAAEPAARGPGAPPGR